MIAVVEMSDVVREKTVNNSISGCRRRQLCAMPDVGTARSFYSSFHSVIQGYHVLTTRHQALGARHMLLLAAAAMAVQM